MTKRRWANAWIIAPVKVDDFRRFLSGGYRMTPPGSGRAAIRAWLSASHPGQPMSLHQAHALIGGQRIDLEPWVIVFLDVADRIKPADGLDGGLPKLLDTIERCDWQPDAALQELRRGGGG